MVEKQIFRLTALRSLPHPLKMRVIATNGIGREREVHEGSLIRPTETLKASVVDPRGYVTFLDG